MLLMRLLTTLFLLLITLSASAQQKAPRQMNYYPDNGDIVCVNGNNRYTRALYGSQTLYRLETSDRPLFATYDKKNNRNISFYIIYKGVSYIFLYNSYTSLFKRKSKIFILYNIHYTNI